jgi:hypothetical protein
LEAHPVTAQTVVQTIQFILAPVVMINACAVVLNGLLARYAVIDDRLRAMTHERLDLLRGAGLAAAHALATADPLTQERVAEIDRQVPYLLLRHQRAQDAVLAVYAAALVFVLTMLLIALAAFTVSDQLAAAALLALLAGTVVLFFGVLQTTREIRISRKAIVFEVNRVLSLGE